MSAAQLQVSILCTLKCRPGFRPLGALALHSFMTFISQGAILYNLQGMVSVSQISDGQKANEAPGR